MTNAIAVKDKKTALQLVAERLNVDPDVLKTTLKKTVFKVKEGDNYREATDEEFVSLMIVSNTYNLNPITKEIYAFPAKGGGIVPVVSTDGWTRLMTTNEKYKSHSFNYSEKLVTMPGAKPCPEWCEIDIERQDGSHVVIREFLDEVFRTLTYSNPWQTHTKRFLRHKTKIQGAREAFGFGGIYDEDEAQRIMEATELPEKAQIEMPRPKNANVPNGTPKPESAAVEVPKNVETASDEAAKPETRPLPPGFELKTAQAEGICKSKGCGHVIKIGTEYAFSKTKGGMHCDCAS